MLARTHLILRVDPAVEIEIDHKAIEQRIVEAAKTWEQRLEEEMSAAYATLDSYIRGDAPSVDQIEWARRKCIEEATSDPVDRRLWTWEARGFDGVSVGDIEAVALGHEAYKELRDGFGHEELPAGVQFIVGEIGETGVQYFNKDRVVRAFQGVSE